MSRLQVPFKKHVPTIVWPGSYYTIIIVFPTSFVIIIVEAAFKKGNIDTIGLVVHQIDETKRGRGSDSPYGRPKRCRLLSTAMVACPVEVVDHSLPEYDGFP